MTNIDFDFPKASWVFPLTDGERRNYIIEERPLPCDFAEKELFLPAKAYTYSGKFRALKWQVEPINSVYYNNVTCLCGPVQMGKTLIAEIGAYWGMAKLGVRGMLGFAVDEKAEEMFIDRYREMIMCKENKVLYDLWDKKEDSLTKNKLRLKNCTWTSASANGKNSFASTTAPFTIGSEVAKWNIKGYDPIQMLRGRSDSAFGLYDSRKMILESSPFEQGDMLYGQFFREGSVILQPHYKCPHCGEWQILSDHQIILRNEELKYRPSKIRQLKSECVYYQCAFCENEISERDRIAMYENVIWAMASIEEEGFKQDPEKIEPDGFIKTRCNGGVRKGYDIHCYWWNRLSDINFPLWECIARFFESLNDDSKRRTYENETMARWWKRKTGKIEKTYLETKKIDYYQWGNRHRIPDDVLIITLGVDSQDNGFYYCFVGWGAYLSWIVLRQGFISCPRVTQGYEHDVFRILVDKLYVEPLKWSDGTVADFNVGCIDKGGHRSDDVLYISRHFPGGKLIAYVGLPTPDVKKPMIYKSPNGDFYLGQSDPISEDVGAYIAGDNFKLPRDVDDEFLSQITRQFHEKRMATDGSISVKWVHNYQGEDHYRDALNLNLAAAKIKGIDKMLLNPQYCDTLRINRSKIGSAIPVNREIKNKPTNNRQYNPRGYFSQLGGRGR